MWWATLIELWVWNQPCLSSETPLNHDVFPPSPLLDSICSHKLDCWDYQTISIFSKCLYLLWYQGNAATMRRMELCPLLPAHCALHPLPTVPSTPGPLCTPPPVSVTFWEEFVLNWVYVSVECPVGCFTTGKFNFLHSLLGFFLECDFVICALYWICSDHLWYWIHCHIITLTFVICGICSAIPLCWYWKPGSYLSGRSGHRLIVLAFPFREPPFGFHWQSQVFSPQIHWFLLCSLCFLSLPSLDLTGSLLSSFLR